MENIIFTTFCILTAIAVIIQMFAMKTKTQVSSSSNPQFKKFQRLFFVVYFMALFSDWLQGPYVYKLYAYYGYDGSQIALLYVAGFGSSVVFGTATGPLADRFGRKKVAICFCILYSICCITKLSSNFLWLMIGRILGGISTSMLFSTFESWYVFEHSERHQFPQDWISVTFSTATFWNGILAINAGIVANVFAETLHYGPVSPFILAIPFLVVAGFIIIQTWNENYGNQNTQLHQSCIQGLEKIVSTKEIFYLGVVQSLFEANMYIFVFQWTPILDTGSTPLGMVFACFMVCIMVGSSIYTLLLANKYEPKQILFIAVLIAMLSMSVIIFSTDERKIPSFISFLFLEVAVGIYFPAIGYLRSQVIPEELRASIMNWFRVPTNLITCAALLLLHNDTIISSNQAMFTICTLMLGVALFCNILFNLNFKSEPERITPADEKQLIEEIS